MSSPPRVVVPSEYIMPSLRITLVPVVGATLSIWASNKIFFAPGTFPGNKPHTLPVVLIPLAPA